MWTRYLALTTIVTMAVPLLAYADSKRINPGQWEIVSTMEMPGTQMKIPPQTTTRCIKPEDVKDPKELIRHGQKDQDCELTDVKQDGNKLTWAVSCKKHGGSGTGEMTYASDSYEGTMTLRMTDPRGVQRQMTQHMKARRTGACTP